MIKAIIVLNKGINFEYKVNKKFTKILKVLKLKNDE